MSPCRSRILASSVPTGFQMHPGEHHRTFGRPTVIPDDLRRRKRRERPPKRPLSAPCSGSERDLSGGAEGIRTPDPLHAMQVRYQLRHSPAV